jgi:hypothetical protein
MAKPACQVAPLDVFLNEKGMAVVLPEAENRHHERVLHAAGPFRLLTQSLLSPG